MSERPVLIVGAGLAGLCCARHLATVGVPVRIFEAADRVGGRIKTDPLDGFLLDRGFQVLLTAYPEAQSVLDYDALQLGRFEPGALIRFQGAFHRLVDPWRRPRHSLATALSPVGGMGDKLRLATLRRQVAAGALADLHDRPETTTIEHLRQYGFSDRMIRRFFRPFFGGVFLDPELKTSSRMFEFVFRMFSQGDAALPARGMEEIPHQIAAGLPAESVRTGTKVAQVGRQHLMMQDGERIEGAAVVVATEGPEAHRLCGENLPLAANSVACLYFAADAPPIEEPILVLNGEQQGPINNLCVPSNVCPNYAPAGAALVSVSLLGAADEPDGVLQRKVREQLNQWFGHKASAWKLLRIYRIPYALPNQSPPALSPVQKPAQTPGGIFVCGDHRDTASIQGAMSSGRRAAEAVLAELGARCS